MLSEKRDFPNLCEDLIYGVERQIQKHSSLNPNTDITATNPSMLTSGDAKPKYSQSHVPPAKLQDKKKADKDLSI